MKVFRKINLVLSVMVISMLITSCSAGSLFGAVSRIGASKLASPLVAAVENGSFDIVKLLVEHGANLSYKDKTSDNETALQVAESFQSTHIIEYLKKQ